MLHFIIKRYLYALIQYRFWFLLIVLVPALYVLLAASMTDRFTICQDLAVSQETPVAAAANPSEYRPLAEVVRDPREFFLNKFALKEVYLELYPSTPVNQSLDYFGSLKETAGKDLTLTMVSENQCRIMYHGADIDTGMKLVNYYTMRLLKKIEEGSKRAALSTRAAQPPASRQPDRAATHEDFSDYQKLLRDKKIQGHRSLWRAERLLPTIQILFITLMVTLVWIGLLEWSDPSFKSKRQIARYVGLPTLGSLPNLNKVSKIIAPAEID